MLATSAGRSDDKPAKAVPTIQKWSGIIRDDETLKRKAPVTGHVADAAQFEMLWKVWRPKEAVPKVDFSKELVVVVTAAGPNQVALSVPLTTRAT